MANIKENWDRLWERINEVCHHSGRSPEEITVVAVAKTIPVEVVKEAVDSGITEIGENRVQEARGKFDVIGDRARWHLVGHLQTNKVKAALEIFELIHSLDSLKLAKEISSRAESKNKSARVLLQVKTTAEESKFGLEASEVSGFIEQIASLPQLQVQGLMTIGPFTDDDTLIRQSFRQLKRLFEELKAASLPNVEMEILSMGMSGDYEIALQEGANMLRIGTSIFGPRR
jgi:pyridoxal phosphate enzyme (YggS family)